MVWQGAWHVIGTACCWSAPADERIPSKAWICSLCPSTLLCCAAALHLCGTEEPVEGLRRRRDRNISDSAAWSLKPSHFWEAWEGMILEDGTAEVKYLTPGDAVPHA